MPWSVITLISLSYGLRTPQIRFFIRWSQMPRLRWAANFASQPRSQSPGPAQLLNLSTRLNVQTGEDVSIGGFIITGNAPKKVMMRGIGPSLTGISPVLIDPVLELHEAGGSLIASNDNWKDSQQIDIQNSTIAPTNDLESAIVATLSPANYTVVLRGKNGTTGIGLAELYDLDPSSDSTLANISIRGLSKPATR